ncbi:MAG: hypothetical protein ABSF45_29230 [Terriglobia bacterium]
MTMHAGLFHLETLAHPENPANLDKLPATGLVILSLPMEVRGASGAPIRALPMHP